jgi:hypothetical protein
LLSGGDDGSTFDSLFGPARGAAGEGDIDQVGSSRPAIFENLALVGSSPYLWCRGELRTEKNIVWRQTQRVTRPKVGHGAAERARQGRPTSMVPLCRYLEVGTCFPVDSINQPTLHSIHHSIPCRRAMSARFGPGQALRLVRLHATITVNPSSRASPKNRLPGLVSRHSDSSPTGACLRQYAIDSPPVICNLADPPCSHSRRLRDGDTAAARIDHRHARAIGRQKARCSQRSGLTWLVAGRQAGRPSRPGRPVARDQQGSKDLLLTCIAAWQAGGRE